MKYILIWIYFGNHPMAVTVTAEFNSYDACNAAWTYISKGISSQNIRGGCFEKGTQK